MTGLARYIAEVDRVRIDLPGQPFHMSILVDPDDALALAAALKVALAQRQKGTTNDRPRARKQPAHRADELREGAGSE